MIKRTTVFIVIFLVGVGSAFASTQDKEKTEAKAIYQQHCAMCHGQDGKGATPIGKKFQIPDLHSSAVQKNSDAELTQIIDNGKGKMPPFKSQLKPEQVKDLVAYIKDMGSSNASSAKK